MKNKNAILLTDFQKSIVSQVLHDELSELTSKPINEITDKVDEIVDHLEKSLFMAVAIEQTRENSFWNKIENLKNRIITK